MTGRSNYEIGGGRMMKMVVKLGLLRVRKNKASCEKSSV